MHPENKNCFGYWFPKVEHCGIPVPKTFYTSLPNTEKEPERANRLYQAFYMENYKEDLAVIQAWLDTDIIPELKRFKLDGHIFIKNSKYSNKFAARRSCNQYGLADLANAIALINYDALCVGADGLEEIVVRQFIECDTSKIPCIYDGLPLRNEFRVFYDFDTQKVIFTANYWDYDYVHPHLHDATDRIIFEHERERIEKTFNLHKKSVEDAVAIAMKNVSDLDGQWSVDILMDERYGLWLIDMATAQRSAYWEQRPDKEAYPE